jgi:hypothetical protein
MIETPNTTASANDSPYFAGGNTGIQGLEPLPGAFNNFIGKIYLKYSLFTIY